MRILIKRLQDLQKKLQSNPNTLKLVEPFIQEKLDEIDLLVQELEESPNVETWIKIRRKEIQSNQAMMKVFGPLLAAWSVMTTN